MPEQIEHPITESSFICNAILQSLDKYSDEEKRLMRLEIIDDIIHRMKFERRLTLLTAEQVKSLHNVLTKECKERLDAAGSDAEVDDLLNMYARSFYFRQLDWTNYLNGHDEEPPIGPVDSEAEEQLRTEAEAMTPEEIEVIVEEVNKHKELNGFESVTMRRLAEAMAWHPRAWDKFKRLVGEITLEDVG